MYTPDNNFSTKSRYYATHRADADTSKCMDSINELIIDKREEFDGLLWTAALEGQLENYKLTAGEMEQYAPPMGEPMAARTDLDRQAAKRFIIIYVNRMARRYSGNPNSVINSAFASIVETMYHIDIITFDEAEEMLKATLKHQS